jgi:HEAT repeat protein
MSQITPAVATTTDENIRRLVAELASDDGLRRREAREALEKIGRRAARSLANALEHPNAHVRWEAAKALTHVHDPVAAPALVRALMDELFEVQWLAAEALIALRRDALLPLFRELTASYSSVYLRQGAHHILHALEKQDLLEPVEERVIEELRSIEPLEPYPVSAKKALEALQHEGTATVEKSTAANDHS